MKTVTEESKSVAKQWYGLNPENQNREIIKKFIYIIDYGITWKKIAQEVSSRLIKEEKEEKLPCLALDLIKYLEDSECFLPDEKIKKEMEEIKSIAVLLTPIKKTD
ncbi:MAG: hypothetical protein RBR98_00425 [Candidatus Moranbacteria bacterium]|jgi:hypothetical protein|nr:hypothetical protein [Candidatus Moranbacteria bacterium]